jgi:hypothetical protein
MTIEGPCTGPLGGHIDCHRVASRFRQRLICSKEAAPRSIQLYIRFGLESRNRCSRLERVNAKQSINQACLRSVPCGIEKEPDQFRLLGGSCLAKHALKMRAGGRYGHPKIFGGLGQTVSFNDAGENSTFPGRESIDRCKCNDGTWPFHIWISQEQGSDAQTRSKLAPRASRRERQDASDDRSTATHSRHDDIGGDYVRGRWKLRRSAYGVEESRGSLMILYSAAL